MEYKKSDNKQKDFTKEILIKKPVPRAEEERITKKAAAVEVINVLQTTKKAGLYGAIGVFAVLGGVAVGGPAIGLALGLPVILFEGYNYMTAKKREEELKIKYEL